MSREKEQRICQLLRETECTIGVIAERCGVSRSCVALLNRRRQIRAYSSHMKWTLVAVLLSLLAPLTLVAALSNSAAVTKSISLWGPQADNRICYHPKCYQVGVRSEGCAANYTVLGQGATSWESAFADYNLKLSAGTVKILGPYSGQRHFQIPFYDVEGTVAGVQLWIDGQPFGSSVTPAAPTSPFRASIPLDTTLLTNGVHVICARAVDADSNHGSSSALLFSVVN